MGNGGKAGNRELGYGMHGGGTQDLEIGGHGNGMNTVLRGGFLAANWRTQFSANTVEAQNVTTRPPGCYR